MRSVLHALVWDNFRFSGWVQLTMLSVALIPVLIYGTILSIVPSGIEPTDPVMHLLEVSMLSLVIFILLLSAAVSHANLSQLFTKPLTNLSIAAWRAISGAVILAVEIGLLVLLYNRVFNAGWPLAGAVLFTLATWFAAQPFFCLAGKSILGTLITMIPIAFMSMWFITRYKPIGGVARDWDAISLSEVLQLLTVIGVFAWCSVHSVGLARRGDGLPLPAGIGQWFASLFSFSFRGQIPAKPFRSASRALFWYEWRWKGWAMSVSMLLLLAILLPAAMWKTPSVEMFLEAVSSAYLGTMVPAMAVGVLSGFQLESMQISTSSLTQSRLSDLDELRSFQAIRPVSDAELGTVNLRVALASIGLMTGLWLLLVLPVMIVALSQGQFDQLSRNRIHLSVVPTMALFLWIFMGNIISLTSTGRTKQLGGVFILLTLVFAGALAVLNWLDNRAFSHMVFQGTLIVSTIALAAFAVWAYMRAFQSGMVKPIGLASALLVTALCTAGGIWLAGYRGFEGGASMLCIGVLCVLPWATTPLAARWNRHR